MTMIAVSERCSTCDQLLPHAKPELQRSVREILGPLLNGSGYTCEDLRAHVRWDHKLNAMRILTMHALRDAGYSVAAIGRTLDRDHSTVLSTLNRRGSRGGRRR